MGSQGKGKERMLPPLLALLRLNRRQYPWLALMVAATAFEGVWQVATGWTFSRLVDTTIGGDTAGFGRFALIMGAMQLLVVATAALSRYSAGRYANPSMKCLRDALCEKLTTARLDWVEKRRTGDVLSVLGNDLGQIAAFYEEHLRWFVGDWVRFAFSLAYLLTLNPWLTLATVAYVPVGALVTTLAGKPVHRLAEAQNEALGGASAIAQDGVAGHAEVKAFRMKPWLSSRFAGALKGWTRAGLKGANAQAAVDAASILNLVLPYMLLICLGLWFVTQGAMSAGQFLAFAFVSNGIVNPLMALTWRTAELRRTAGASARLMEMLAVPAERAGGGDPDVDPAAPLLSFRNVSFSYERAGVDGEAVRQAVFEGLDLDVLPGETVAVVGPSGSGKSTLLKLAAGLYEPEGGQVLFGGAALANWSLPALRGHLAMVDQDTYLFPGSILENVSCGARGGPQAAGVPEVERAVRQASLSGFAEAQPDGLGTPVGERGARLSGGQRQRVAIARAILRGASLLLMDEPTSALDAATEKEIQRELIALAEGRTALIVTHRLSMAHSAHRIVVLHAGKVAEQGTHEELMRAGGLYRALYNEQAGPEGGEAA